MRRVAAVAAGGALGAPARYAISDAIHISPGSFPWATFWINVAGSFALGLLLLLLVERAPRRHALRLFVTTGFLGTFTAFFTAPMRSQSTRKKEAPVKFAKSASFAGRSFRPTTYPPAVSI